MLPYFIYARYLHLVNVNCMIGGERTNDSTIKQLKYPHNTLFLLQLVVEKNLIALMKRHLLLTFILLCFAFSIQAQNHGVAAEDNSAGKGSKLHLGFVGSGSLYKLFFFDSQPFKSSFTFGYDGGIMASLTMRKRFKLNAQLLYSHQTKKVTGNTLDLKGYQLKSSMNYIQLPIFYSLEFKSVSKGTSVGNSKVYDWFIGAGPTLQYWLNTKGTLRSGYLVDEGISPVSFTGVFNKTENYTNDKTKELLPDANRFQFGINLTAGLTFDVDDYHKLITSLQLNVMQTYTGKSVGDFPASPQEDKDLLRAKNHSLRISVAYLFDTKIEKRSKGKSTSKLSNKNKRKR